MAVPSARGAHHRGSRHVGARLRDPARGGQQVSPTFGSLQYHNYRLWFAGAMVSNVGTWMQRVAQDWLVLTVLSHDSGVAVGVITALQFAPIMPLAAWAAWVPSSSARRGTRY